MRKFPRYGEHNFRKGFAYRCVENATTTKTTRTITWTARTRTNPSQVTATRKCTQWPCKLPIHDSHFSTQMRTVPYDKGHAGFIAGYSVSNHAFCRKHGGYPFCSQHPCFFDAHVLQESLESNICQSPVRGGTSERKTQQAQGDQVWQQKCAKIMTCCSTAGSNP